MTFVCIAVLLGIVVAPSPAQTPAAPRVPARGGGAPQPPGLPNVSVVIQTGSSTAPIVPETPRLRVIDAQADSLRALVGIFPADEAPPAATGASPATFVWLIQGRASGRPVEGRRPVFLVSFKDAGGVNAADLVPAIVRLAPTLSGVRLLAAVRARADQPTRAQADWNIGRDLRQETVGTRLDMFEPGSARLQPSAPLDRGEYAVVLRFRGERQVAGVAVLSQAGEGRVMATAWTFSVN